MCPLLRDYTHRELIGLNKLMDELLLKEYILPYKYNVFMYVQYVQVGFNRGRYIAVQTDKVFSECRNCSGTLY